MTTCPPPELVDAVVVGLTEPHHDGSAQYVSHLSPRLGDVVTVRLRVPHEFPVDTVYLRTVRDGEPVFLAAQVMGRTDTDRTSTDRASTDTWWSVDLVCHNAVTPYRWALAGGEPAYAWLNGTGLHHRDVPDASDFRLVAHDTPPPAWATGAVVYQIVPDRFARSAAADRRALPEWAVPATWDDEVDISSPRAVAKQFYGGDLDGITEHLDHLERLGVDAIYLTPVFPSRSHHRYDATTFDRIDPLLGGDAALRRLTAAAHERGLRVVGDLTTNHCGVGHDWFVAATTQSAAGEPPPVERDFFYWVRGRHVGWLGVRSLPKFNWSSLELRRRFFDGRHGVVRKWLSRSGGLDGWRVDVANMSGRYRGTELNHDVARWMRTAMRRHPEALLVAEHCHDYTVDLPGDGWHGVMNYAGFCKPVWTWLRGDKTAINFLGSPVPVPELDGVAVAETMRDFTSRVSWQTVVHSFNLVGSHDTARIRSLVGEDRDQVEVAAGLLFTMPGMPMLTYGDEIGMPGRFGEDGRRPLPWDESRWDLGLFEVYRQLIAARRGSLALREGGLRWVYAGADVLVYLREHEEETALVQVARAAHATVAIPAYQLPGIDAGSTQYGPAPAIRDGFVMLESAGPGVTIHTWPTAGASRDTESEE